MSLQNEAVWLAKQGASFQPGPAPITKPGPGQLLVQNHAVAINPVDWKQREFGFYIKDWPVIIGCDLAGTIVEVGDGVDSFQAGQRVLAHPLALDTAVNAHAGFQKYTVVEAVATARLPDSISYSAACALPLSLDTAAHGLYGKEHLSLPLPSNSPENTGKTVLVWGGSSSVGAAAVQLAVASGLSVISTASPRNFAFVKKLGATDVYDYNKSSVVADMVSLLGGKEFVGAYDGKRQLSHEICAWC